MHNEQSLTRVSVGVSPLAWSPIVIHYEEMADSISFVEFTLDDGNPVFINLAQIVCFEPSDEQTLVTLTSGRCLTVRETLDAVGEIIGSDETTGC